MKRWKLVGLAALAVCPMVAAYVLVEGGNAQGMRVLWRSIRTPEVSEREFRDFLASLSWATSHPSVRWRMGAYDSLKFSDRADSTRVETLPAPFWSERRPSIFAELRYLPDGALFYLETGYVRAVESPGDRVPGVPSEHCLLPSGQCAAALDAHRSARQATKSP